MNNIEADGEWGIPLVNDKITISQILNKINNMGNLPIDNDMGISFIYDLVRNDFIKASDFLKFDDRHIEGSDNIPSITQPLIPGYVHVPFPSDIVCNLNSDLFKIKHALIKSGTLVFNFNSNSTYTFTGEVSTDQIKSPAGDNLTIPISNHSDILYNLAGYSIFPEDTNAIVFKGTLKLYFAGAPIGDIPYSYEITFQNLKFQNILAQFNRYEVPIDEEMLLGLDLEHITGNVQIVHPKLSLYTKNSFNVGGLYEIDTAEFFNDENSNSPLITHPIQIPFGTSPDQYAGGIVNEIPAVNFDTKYDRLKATGKLILNPDGYTAHNIAINENAAIGMKIEVEAPLNISIEHCLYKDTSNNGLFNIVHADNIDSIAKLTFRLVVTNKLPFEIIPQFWFYNSTDGSIDSLLTDNIFIHGGYNDVPFVSEPIYIEVPTSKIKQIVQSDKLILSFRLNTNGNTVYLKTDQYLYAKLGAKIQYASLSLK